MNADGVKMLIMLICAKVIYPLADAFRGLFSPVPHPNINARRGRWGDLPDVCRPAESHWVPVCIWYPARYSQNVC